ncbi:MAG TPA: hypothetical protein PLS10_13710, partial [Chitinophagales bacterium]|nr:hypothetical protein [Chitinophagales bacterium]
ENYLSNEPTVILFDEISWMGEDDPTFVGKLKIWWDSIAVRDCPWILILCGSVSTWIEKNIISNTALFGRISLQIDLAPLTLPESGQFIKEIEMKLLYGDKCTVTGYYLKDELVSFACLFHVDPTTLHVHYIGLNYEVNKEYKLYNRMLLDFVKFAIMKDKINIHFGRTATEIKTTIGAEPKALHAYLKMNNSIVNNTLPYFLKRIKPAEFIARNPFK